MNRTTRFLKNYFIVLSFMSATSTQPGLFSCCLGEDDPESVSVESTQCEPKTPTNMPLLQANAPLVPEPAVIMHSYPAQQVIEETATAFSDSIPTEYVKDVTKENSQSYKNTFPILPFCSNFFAIKDPAFQSCRFVHTITSIQEIAQECEQADEKTLVLLDIDDTLEEDKDPTFQSRFIYADDPSLKRYEELYHQFIKKLGNNPDSLFSHSKLVALQKKCLVEPKSAQLIKNLQQKKVSVIALSAFAGGPCGDDIPDFHDFRYQQLLDNGIDLNQPLPTVNIQAFNDAVKIEAGSFDTIFLKCGIVSSSFAPKGVVARCLIEHMNPRPEKVVFVDDNRRNHHTIAMAIKILNMKNFKESSNAAKTPNYIMLSNFLYTAARIIGPSDHIDPIVARTQFDLMDKQRTYVSYDEAERLLAAQRRPTAILHRLLNEQMTLNYFPQQSLHIRKTSNSYATPTFSASDSETEESHQH